MARKKAKVLAFLWNRVEGGFCNLRSALLEGNIEKAKTAIRYGADVTSISPTSSFKARKDKQKKTKATD
ncbi:MAG: hypothetical protein ACHQT8_04785 [Chlamydiales bacterium]